MHPEEALSNGFMPFFESSLSFVRLSFSRFFICGTSSLSVQFSWSSLTSWSKPSWKWFWSLTRVSRNILKMKKHCKDKSMKKKNFKDIPVTPTSKSRQGQHYQCCQCPAPPTSRPPWWLLVVHWNQGHWSRNSKFHRFQIFEVLLTFTSRDEMEPVPRKASFICSLLQKHIQAH